MSDAAFAVLKNQILSMAHGGIGLAFLHRKDFAGSIPELEEAIGFGTNDDATNFYLLGVASQNSRHYDQAEVAFEKCAAMRGNLQATCSSGLEQAKKSAAQQAPPK